MSDTSDNDQAKPQRVPHLFSIPIDPTITESADGRTLLHDNPPAGHIIYGEGYLCVWDRDRQLTVALGETMTVNEYKRRVMAEEITPFYYNLKAPAMSFDATKVNRRSVSEIEHIGHYTKEYIHSVLDAQLQRNPPTDTMQRYDLTESPAEPGKAQRQLVIALHSQSSRAFLRAWYDYLYAQGPVFDLMDRQPPSYMTGTEETFTSIPRIFPEWVVSKMATMSHSPRQTFALSSITALGSGRIMLDVREADLALIGVESRRATHGPPKGKFRWIVAPSFQDNQLMSVLDCKRRWEDSRDLHPNPESVSLVGGILTAAQRHIAAFIILPSFKRMAVLLPVDCGEEDVRDIATYVYDGFFLTIGGVSDDDLPDDMIRYYIADADANVVLQAAMTKDLPTAQTIDTVWASSLVEADMSSGSVASVMLARLIGEMLAAQDLINALDDAVYDDEAKAKVKVEGARW